MTSSVSPTPYPHWMLREIHEQPATLATTLARYVDSNGFRAEACDPIRGWLRNCGGAIVIAASGSSRHAGLVAELLIEELSGIAVDVEYASEYSYSSEKVRHHGSVMVISQSGETADTLASLRKAQGNDHETLAITNVATSTMAREATVSFPTEAGRERAVPATKSFTAQLLNLYLLALLAGEVEDKLLPEQVEDRLSELRDLPAKIAAQLDAWECSVREIATHYGTAQSFLFLGRSVHNPIAREGALKLKESAYLHAEGYPSGELKHGPNALVSEQTPLVMVATVDHSDPDSELRYEKVVQLMRDMREQGARILAIANTGDSEVAQLANNTIFVEEASEALLPLCEVIPMQLFSYFMAINNGIDVDNPRNLTKAVLAE
ncbi:glucosamine--fructose-6-phosphate aminotransferase (isomerizing) [Granulicella aggregans]|uniref:Glutamine--fructose-6-phosphate aminotransferase [isomerizing] n=1 Tax=Granulicella aggregans TaxID=474949 RepID=A0A7W7Z9T8_9BACT|nr:SIS domain-containing protein [Granulicella aggregans]MBB5055973.1 glucosamine--fructose-6-phosphate aminotransferase (isomerizing) [Granulicella aggregans]